MIESRFFTSIYYILLQTKKKKIQRAVMESVGPIQRERRHLSDIIISRRKYYNNITRSAAVVPKTDQKTLQQRGSIGFNR